MSSASQRNQQNTPDTPESASSTMDFARQPRSASVAADLLKAVAHPLRLRILSLLAEQPHHVTSLCDSLGAPQAAVSQQLRILRAYGLADATREGGYATYHLTEPKVRDLLCCLSGCMDRRGRGQHG